MAGKWTRNDEQRYAEMTARRDAFEIEHGEALRNLCHLRLIIGTDAPEADAVEIDRVYQILRSNADAFRDALAPFDSGVRCASEVSDG